MLRAFRVSWGPMGPPSPVFFSNPPQGKGPKKIRPARASIGCQDKPETRNQTAKSLNECDAQRSKPRPGGRVKSTQRTRSIAKISRRPRVNGTATPTQTTSRTGRALPLRSPGPSLGPPSSPRPSPPLPPPWRIYRGKIINCLIGVKYFFCRFADSGQKKNRTPF